jgi:intracellular septation protein
MTKRELIGNAFGEFAPILTFVIVAETHSFHIGLIWLVFVAALSLVLSWIIERRIPKFGLVASGTILLFGMMSIVSGDEFYIIIKDTLYASSFGLALLGGLIFKRSYLQVLFGEFFAITEKGWFILTVRWTVFFFLLAASNELARRFLSPELWIYYKLAAVVVTNVFGFYQFTLTRRERLPEANEWGLRVKA